MKTNFFGTRFELFEYPQNLVVPLSGRRLLARIGAETGTCDRGGAIGPPNRSENDDGGGGGVGVYA